MINKRSLILFSSRGTRGGGSYIGGIRAVLSAWCLFLSLAAVIQTLLTTQSGIYFPALIVLCDSNPLFVGDAIDREEYVPRCLDETDSSSPVHPMSVSGRRQSQSTSRVDETRAVERDDWGCS